MKKYLLIFAAVVALPVFSALAEPDPATQTIFTNLIATLVADNYDGYMADCTADMKASISKPNFDHLSQMLALRTGKGYDTQYLGELNQHGYKVHLWSLRFKDGSDDVLTTLCLKDGKAGSFNVMLFALYPPR